MRKKTWTAHASSFRSEGANNNHLWVTKEGWTVQIRSMTDLHLLHTLMMLLEKVRRETYHRREAEEVKSFSEEALAYRPEIAQIFHELQFRGILARLPETY